MWDAKAHGSEISTEERLKMRKKILLSIALSGFLGIAMGQSPSGGGQSPSGSSGSGSSPSGGGSAGSPGSMDSGMGNNPDAMSMKKVDDKKFLKDAAAGGLAEVEFGKVAAQKGSSEEVKKFGQKMVDDHSKANDELKEVAGKEKIEVPTALTSKEQSKLDKMSKLSGADFDKAYIKDMVRDHEKDVSDFQSEAQSGSSANVKAFATKTLPTLQEHLSMAKDINKSAKSSSSKGGSDH
jgi:putative membrane protein